jgi:hypothetical protein
MKIIITALIILGLGFNQFAFAKGSSHLRINGAGKGHSPRVKIFLGWHGSYPKVSFGEKVNLGGGI